MNCSWCVHDEKQFVDVVVFNRQCLNMQFYKSLFTPILSFVSQVIIKLDLSFLTDLYGFSTLSYYVNVCLLFFYVRFYTNLQCVLRSV